MNARDRIPNLWLRLALWAVLPAVSAVVLMVVPGCTEKILQPATAPGALKVALQPAAAAVDHGWLVVDQDAPGRMRMARVDNYLESPPFEIAPGRHLFAITACDKDERPLFFGQASDSVLAGAAFLSLEIVLRPADPVCVVAPEALDFGTLALGASGIDSLTVANADTALGTLTLDLPAVCGAFRLLTGSGTTLLAPGERLVVTIACEPLTAGPQDCVLSFGPGCEVALAAQGQALPECALAPAGGLDFGEVPVGSAARLSFSVTNAGGGILTGLIGEAVGAGFTVVQGGGAYSLEAGQTRTVQVEFAPEAEGTVTGSVATGSVATGADCGPVVLTGEGQALPVCAIGPVGQALDFGVVTLGETAQLGFTVTNTGGGILEGQIGQAVVTQGAGFAVIQGGGTFSLGAGQSRSVLVEFAPQAEGPAAGSVATGTDCGAVALAGVGQVLPLCAIVPSGAALDFGEVPLGSSGRLSFTVSNAGGGVLEGRIGAASAETAGAGFTVVLGEGVFSLAAGQSRAVEVEFAPEAAGAHTGSVATGTDCGAVALQGLGQALPLCAITPESGALDFGTVVRGASARLSFTVTNVGGGVLEGEIGAVMGDNAGAGFTVLQGQGPFSLAAGEARTVDVEFAPTTAGAHTGSVATGTDCGAVALSGQGEALPECAITPQSLALDFGVVPVGASADLQFTVANVGGGVLNGTIAEDLPYCSLVSGGGDYTLAAGQTRVVTVRFTPPAAGVYDFQIDTGTACAAVPCTGIGEDAPLPVITPTFLDFGTVVIGDTSVREFTVANGGGGILVGYVYEVCDGFAVVGGGGPFALTAGQILTVTVEFAPTAADTFLCFLQTATKGNHVACAGVGVKPPAPMPLEPASLDFGRVPVGGTRNLTFTVNNPGEGMLKGDVKENCRQYRVTQGGGDFILPPGGSRVVTVQFAPDQVGVFACAIRTGDDKCEDCCRLPVTGEGVPAETP